MDLFSPEISDEMSQGRRATGEAVHGPWPRSLNGHLVGHSEWHKVGNPIGHTILHSVMYDVMVFAI